MLSASYQGDLVVDISETPAAIDVHEAPQSRQRKKVAKETAARKRIAAKVQDTYFEITNGKLIKVTVSGTGNTHRIYQCNNDKKNAEFIAGLKKKGQIRA